MKKKKTLTLIAIMSSVILALTILAILFLPKTDIGGPNGGIVKLNNPVTAVTPTLINTEDPDSLENQIYGIPASIFNSTVGRSFDFSIKDNRDGYVFDLTLNSKCSDFEYEFLEDPDPSHKPVSDPETLIQKIEPGKTKLNVEGDYDKPNDIMVFGGLNETDQTITGFDLATIVYVSYRGSSDWTLCGLNTSMSKEDVIAKYGEPTQEMPSDEGYRLEYYILVDGHPYVLTAMIDEETNMVCKIEWLRDNLPVFIDNIVPDDVIWPDYEEEHDHDHDHEENQETTSTDATN